MNISTSDLAMVCCSLASSLAKGAKEIYNYYPLPNGLGSSGQPHPPQFADIRAAGFNVVVNLAMPTSDNALAEEGRLVSETGMTYVHIPVPWEAPDGPPQTILCCGRRHARSRPSLGALRRNRASACL